MPVVRQARQEEPAAIPAPATARAPRIDRAAGSFGTMRAERIGGLVEGRIANGRKGAAGGAALAGATGYGDQVHVSSPTCGPAKRSGGGFVQSLRRERPIAPKGTHAKGWIFAIVFAGRIGYAGSGSAGGPLGPCGRSGHGRGQSHRRNAAGRAAAGGARGDAGRRDDHDLRQHGSAGRAGRAGSAPRPAADGRDLVSGDRRSGRRHGL